MSACGVVTLKERKLREAERERAIFIALTSRNSILDFDKRIKKQKKKTVDDLLARLDISGMKGAILRPANDYVSRSYNLERQLVGLLTHMFVAYPVPSFMFQACLDDQMVGNRAMYKAWFLAMAQGGSFRKLAKEYMTAREAHLFLSAPANNTIHENVWWAKMTVAGLPVALIDRLIQRLFTHYRFDVADGGLSSIIHFFTQHHNEVNRATQDEIVDFITWKLRNDAGFTMKGRTVSSIVKLTHKWHVQMQIAKLGRLIDWKGMLLPDWEHEGADRIWTMTELISNAELLTEGRKQRHCVYTYVGDCVMGRSHIFSLRSYRKSFTGYTESGVAVWNKSIEMERVTVEVNARREVVQMRGPLNRNPSTEELTALRIWALEARVTISQTPV